MGLHSGDKRCSNLLALLLALAVAMALPPSLGNAQKAHSKLTSQDIVDLLTADTSSDDVAKTAQEEGISFQVTPSVEKRIRDVGGTDELIRILRSLAPASHSNVPVPNPNPPRVSSPPVLLVESRPGQCQVYVDDEPVGSTSQEGRLKLTRVVAGDHHVRIAQNGYQDYEQNVTLAAGETATVTATLQQVQTPVPEPVNPKPEPPNPVTPVNPGTPGYLGVQAKASVAGRGVMVVSTAPGGPAAQAGLQPNNVILAVNGQSVNSPAELRSALAGHQAGEAVQISWYNGASTVTRSVQLSGQAPVPPPPVSTASFAMAHDHGQSAQNYCTGVMTIANGTIYYKGVKGSTGNNIHSYQIPLDTIKEARRNTVYLVNLGAFHIRTKKNSNFNFVALDQNGKPGPPDAVLTAIDAAMGR